MLDSFFPDFRLYHSNSLETLADLLAVELRKRLTGHSPLVPETILIPQAAMRRWLQATLAAEYGVAANLEFLTPGEFVAQALNANVPGEAEDLNAAALHWRLYAALTDKGFMQHPALASLRSYLAHDDPLRPWALAEELADIFEKYQAWRRDWLLAWESGAQPSDPQALLWRHIADKRQHRARRIDHYLTHFAQPGSPRPQGLPARLFVFATLNVSPDVLRVIASQARIGVLHFYLPSPTRAYWGDMQTLAEKLRSGAEDPFVEDENPLLQAWGAAGRDFVEVLGSYEVVHPRGEIEAYTEPEENPNYLLHRLQADLFHRRCASEPLRSFLDKNDFSLQIHACHTPLREVQVLHDQLRALLEDSRFNPPLEPRQIAVLAPDITPYVPWLEAVFGSRSGEGGHIPWTLADSSPLHDEPLAELFMQLLALPLSRFGLSELLDLLASAPLAQTTGLDTPAVERLQHWLYKAGARWGLNAAHRQQHQAPADNAYTWQFALDRLLLGYASGSSDEIGQIAPWPHLEGSALNALDTLLGLLRVLARQRHVLAEALPPLQWQQRLLALLHALLPENPVDTATARALERLQRLIYEFADNATRAGFSDPVSAEVVRAHFANVLAQTDTRAPLLTGGVSFGRMVPLRLLPFRVICVLGMNDGDYPRRDPVAGLSRLTADLHSNQRRRGDRSLREDDRFLFLQLFSAAKEVFYLSYLGANPRDGRAREPSVLVSDLIEAAAANHIKSIKEDVRKNLIIRHPLHPFASAAFGAPDEPRRFSYQQQWYRAAGCISGARHALEPWCDSGFSLAHTTESHLPLAALYQFLKNPTKHFLKHRLGVRLAEDIDQGQDVEPLIISEKGYVRQQLNQHVFDELLHGRGEQLYERLRARALLPSGALAKQQLEALSTHIQPCVEAFKHWHDGAVLQAEHCQVEVAGWELYATVTDIHPQGLIRCYPGELGPSWIIRCGLDWLLLNASGHALPMVQFFKDDTGHYGPHTLPALAQTQAQAALALLLDHYIRGQQGPLLYTPRAGWYIYKAMPMQREKTAHKHWHGSDHSWGEVKNAQTKLLFRANDPLANKATMRQFIHNSCAIFTALCEGQILAQNPSLPSE